MVLTLSSNIAVFRTEILWSKWVITQHNPWVGSQRKSYKSFYFLKKFHLHFSSIWY